MLKRDNVLTKGVFKMWQTAAKSPSHKFYGFADEEIGFIGTNGVVVYRIPKEVNHPFKDSEDLPDAIKKHLKSLFTGEGRSIQDTGELKTTALGLARKFNGIDRNFYVREDFISPFHGIYESVDYIQKNVIRLYVKDEYLAICAVAGLEREGE